MFGDILNEAYLILKIASIVGLLVLISYGISKKSAKKYIVTFIVSLSLTILFALIFLLDYYVFGTNIRPKIYLYFITTGLVYTTITLIFLIRNRRKLVFNKKTEPKKQMVYTVHNKNEYIYCFAKNNEWIYLLDNSYTGVKYHLKKKEFCDEAITKVLKSFGELDVLDLRRDGIVTVKGEREDDVYYCYLLELNEELTMKGFTKVSIYDISDLSIDRVDKYIILKCLTDSDFTDTI